MLLGQHGQNDQPRLFLSVHQISAYKLNGCLMISMRSAWALLPATCIDCPPWSSSSENERLRLCCWSAGKLWGNYSDSTSDRVSGIFRLTNDTRRTRRPPTFIFSLPSPAPPHCPASPCLLAALSPVSDRRRRDPALPGIRCRRSSANSPNNNSGRPRSQIFSRQPDHSTSRSSRCRCDACLIVNKTLLRRLYSQRVSSATRSF